MSIDWDSRLDPPEDYYYEEDDEMEYEADDLAIHIRLEDEALGR